VLEDTQNTGACFKMEWKQIVSSFVVFAMIVGLFMTAYDGLRAEYGFIPQDTNDDGESIMQELANINIIGGINESVTAVYKISPPTGAQADILGALASAGLGILKIVTGVITFPIEIIGVITGFYYIPPIVSVGVGLIFIIYMAFKLLEDYRRRD